MKPTGSFQGKDQKSDVADTKESSNIEFHKHHMDEN